MSITKRKDNWAIILMKALLELWKKICKDSKYKKYLVLFCCQSVSVSMSILHIISGIRCVVHLSDPQYLVRRRIFAARVRWVSCVLYLDMIPSHIGQQLNIYQSTLTNTTPPHNISREKIRNIFINDWAVLWSIETMISWNYYFFTFKKSLKTSSF